DSAHHHGRRPHGSRGHLRHRRRRHLRRRRPGRRTVRRSTRPGSDRRRRADVLHGVRRREPGAAAAGASRRLPRRDRGAPDRLRRVDDAAARRRGDRPRLRGLRHRRVRAFGAPLGAGRRGPARRELRGRGRLRRRQAGRRQPHRRRRPPSRFAGGVVGRPHGTVLRRHGLADPHGDPRQPAPRRPAVPLPCGRRDLARRGRRGRLRHGLGGVPRRRHPGGVGDPGAGRAPRRTAHAAQL
ncbi:MAG: hypothetical protein AVDCRST_MAG32-2872, partial [uncultured Nocardioides sp.]